jgi:hypothetical protein
MTGFLLMLFLVFEQGSLLIQDCAVSSVSCFFGCLDEELAPELPLHVVARVQNAWEALRLRASEANNNPVHRVPLYAYRINDALCIDPVVPLQHADEDGGAPGAIVAGTPGVPTMAGGRGNQQQCGNDSYQALLIQMQHQRQQMPGMGQQIDGSLDSFWTWTRNRFTIVSNNVHRFGGLIQRGLAWQDPAQAVERQAASNQQVDATDNKIGGSLSLMPAPKTLHALHTEWQFGIGEESLLEYGICEKERNKLAVLTSQGMFW